jgi:chromosome segregation ATPase
MTNEIRNLLDSIHPEGLPDPVNRPERRPRPPDLTPELNNAVLRAGEADAAAKKARDDIDNLDIDDAGFLRDIDASLFDHVSIDLSNKAQKVADARKPINDAKDAIKDLTKDGDKLKDAIRNAETTVDKLRDMSNDQTNLKNAVDKISSARDAASGLRNANKLLRDGMDRPITANKTDAFRLEADIKRLVDSINKKISDRDSAAGKRDDADAKKAAAEADRLAAADDAEVSLAGTFMAHEDFDGAMVRESSQADALGKKLSEGERPVKKFEPSDAAMKAVKDLADKIHAEGVKAKQDMPTDVPPVDRKPVDDANVTKKKALDDAEAARKAREDNAKKALDDAKVLADSITKDLDDATKRLDDANKDVTDADAANDSSSSKRDALEAEVVRMAAEVATLKENLRKLNDDTTKLRDLLESIHPEGLPDPVNRPERRPPPPDATEGLNRVKTKVDEADAGAKNTDQAIRDLDLDDASFLSNIDSGLFDDVSNKRDALTDATTALNDAKTKISDLNKDNTNLKDALKDAGITVDKLKEILNDKTNLENTVDGLRTLRDAASGLRDSIRTLREGMDSTNKSDKSDAHRVEAKIKDLMDSINKKNSERDSSRTKRDDAEAKRLKAKEDRDAAADNKDISLADTFMAHDDFDAAIVREGAQADALGKKLSEGDRPVKKFEPSDAAMKAVNDALDKIRARRLADEGALPKDVPPADRKPVDDAEAAKKKALDDAEALRNADEAAIKKALDDAKKMSDAISKELAYAIKRLEATRKDVTDADSANDSSRSKKDADEAEAARREAEIADLKNKLRKLDDKVTEIQDLLKSLHPDDLPAHKDGPTEPTKPKDLSETLAKLKDAVDGLHTARDDVDAAIKKILDDSKKLTNDERVALERVRDGLDSLDAAIRERLQREGDLAGAKTKKKTLDDADAAALKRVEALKDIAKSLDKYSDISQRRNIERSKAEGDAAARKKAIDDAKAKKDDANAKDKLAKKDDAADKMNQLKKLMDDIDALKKRRDSGEDDGAALTKKIAELEALHKKLLDALDSKNMKDMKDVLKKIRDAETKKKALDDDLAKNKKEIEDLEKKIKDEDDPEKRKKLEDEQKKKKKERDDIEQKIKKAKEDIDKLKKDLDKLKKERDDLEALKKKLKDEIAGRNKPYVGIPALAPMMTAVGVAAAVGIGAAGAFSLPTLVRPTLTLGPKDDDYERGYAAGQQDGISAGKNDGTRAGSVAADTEWKRLHPAEGPRFPTDAAPEAAPEGNLGPAPEGDLEAVPEAAPEGDLEAVPEAAPNSDPEAAPEGDLEAVPEAAPNSDPEAPPNTATKGGANENKSVNPVFKSQANSNNMNGDPANPSVNANLANPLANNANASEVPPEEPLPEEEPLEAPVPPDMPTMPPAQDKLTPPDVIPEPTSIPASLTKPLGMSAKWNKGYDDGYKVGYPNGYKQSWLSGFNSYDPAKGLQLDDVSSENANDKVHLTSDKYGIDDDFMFKNIIAVDYYEFQQGTKTVIVLAEDIDLTANLVETYGTKDDTMPEDDGTKLKGFNPDKPENELNFPLYNMSGSYTTVDTLQNGKALNQYENVIIPQYKLIILSEDFNPVGDDPPKVIETAVGEIVETTTIDETVEPTPTDEPNDSQLGGYQLVHDEEVIPTL